MRIFTLIFLFITTVVFSQDRIKHVVASGETIYSISKKYDVKESEIFDLNPKAKSSSLQLKSVLWIPNKKNEPKETPAPKGKSKSKEESNLTITHLVLAKETLYGISKKYGTTVDKIKEANPSIVIGGLKEGGSIVVPVSKEAFASQPYMPTKTTVPVVVTKVQRYKIPDSENNDDEITHHVMAKETKYGISKRYNISIAELERLNPKIVKGLSIDDELIIREGKVKELPVPVPVSVPVQNATAKLPSMSKAEFLIAKASENIGVPYCYGGTDKNGFDCSGLVFCTFKQIDMILPRTSQDMADNAGIKIDRSQAQKGDLIFFDTLNQGGVSHVGMVTEVSEDEIKFIHASSSSGVMISSTKEDYFAERVVQINRVLEN